MVKRYNITKKDILKVLSKNNLSLSSYSKHKGENGVINTIYFIKTKENRELILRIINPLKKWKKIKTINEVEVINFIYDNTNVPVPKIIDYSYNKNLIGYEYILMTKLKGEILANSYYKIGSRKRINYIKQITNYLSEINKFKFNKIGNFNQNMQLSKLVDTNIGPFTYYSDYIYSTINQYLKTVDKRKFKKEIKLISDFNENYIKNLKLKEYYALCHYDLSLENILVSNWKITGFIDFEWSGSYPLIEEFITFNDNFKLNKYKDCKLEFEKILKKSKIKYKFSKKVQSLSKLQINTMCLSEYKDWFNNKKDANEFIEKVIIEIKQLTNFLEKK